MKSWYDTEVSGIAVDPAALNIWSILRRTWLIIAHVSRNVFSCFFILHLVKITIFYVHSEKFPSFEIVVCYIQFWYMPKLKTKHLSLCIETDLSNNLELYLRMNCSCTDQQQCNSVLCCVFFLYIYQYFMLFWWLHGSMFTVLMMTWR